MQNYILALVFPIVCLTASVQREPTAYNNSIGVYSEVEMPFTNFGNSNFPHQNLGSELKYQSSPKLNFSLKADLFYSNHTFKNKYNQ